MSRFKAVMFVICSYSLFFFFFTIMEALWSGGQSSDFWSNFLAQSRFSSAVSWKNFQCLLKIAQGSTLCALTHKHTHLYAHTGAHWPRLNVYNPILHPPPGREDYSVAPLCLWTPVTPQHSFLQCPGRHMVAARISVQIKVRVLYIVVEADMGMTSRTQSARATPTASVSRSMGLHVWDGMRDFPREPHVMWDAAPLRTRASRARKNIYARVCASQAIWKNTRHIVCLRRLAWLLQWLQTSLDIHSPSISMCAAGEDATKAKSKRVLAKQRSQAWVAFQHVDPARRQTAGKKGNMKENDDPIVLISSRNAPTNLFYFSWNCCHDRFKMKSPCSSGNQIQSIQLFNMLQKGD